MTRRQRIWLIGCLAGCLIAAAVPVGAGAALMLAVHVPPPHRVRTDGATAVPAQAFIGLRPPFNSSLPAPTMKLDDLRCAAWQTTSRDPCPDPSELAKDVWVDATQAPNTLYIGVQDMCDTYGNDRAGFNVEYLSSRKTLIVHCVSAQAWFLERDRGSRQIASIVLIAASTAAIPAGTVSVWEDDRVEHLVGDDSAQTLLGIVAIA